MAIAMLFKWLAMRTGLYYWYDYKTFCSRYRGKPGSVNISGAMVLQWSLLNRRSHPYHGKIMSVLESAMTEACKAEYYEAIEQHKAGLCAETAWII